MCVTIATSVSSVRLLWLVCVTCVTVCVTCVTSATSMCGACASYCGSNGSGLMIRGSGGHLPAHNTDHGQHLNGKQYAKGAPIRENT